MADSSPGPNPLGGTAMKGLARKIQERMRDLDKVASHRRAVLYPAAKRRAAMALVPEWEELRDANKKAKAEILSDLDGFLDRFQESAEARGTTVHRARNAAQAQEKVLDLCKAAGVQCIVKSKSLTMEECQIGPKLEQTGIELIDTDLGERIVQLFGEPPSHLTAPAIHRTREEIGQLFYEHGLVPKGETDPKILTEAARKSLRPYFLKADLGMTGANFLVASTGSIIVVENEANSILGTSLAPFHIAVAGIDKLVPDIPSLQSFLALLARSATGQRLTTYTTHYTGTMGRPLHLVLVDNGRSSLRGTPAEEALACIRCGACLNECPVYCRIGGHSYDWVYPGPIGEVLGPALSGGPRNELVKASPLCQACSDVCPVRIDLARHIHDWRLDLSAQGQLKPSLPSSLRHLWGHPFLFRAAGKFARHLGPLSPVLAGFTKAGRAWKRGGRNLPKLPKKSFHELLKARRKSNPPQCFPHSPIQEKKEIAPSPTPPNSPSAPKHLHFHDLRKLFREALEEAHGKILPLSALPNQAMATPKAMVIGAELGKFWTPSPSQPWKINGCPLLILSARHGIARTGSLWVELETFEERLALTLPEEIILLVPEDRILFDLPQHAAELKHLPPCGTLLTGPSKTADIELSLVIGAHGPRRMSVCWIPSATSASK